MKGIENPVNFNMAWLWFLTLNDLLRKKYETSMQRDAMAYYLVLDTIFTHVFMKINKDKRQEIESDLKSVEGKVITVGRITEKQQNYNLIEGFIECKKIDRKMMIILDNQKLFFPDIKFSLGLEEIHDRFKLDKTSMKGARS